MSLLKQNTTRKKQVDKKVTEIDFEAGNSKEYEVEAIWDSTVYANKAKCHLPGLYYLVAWKRYSEEENTWELSSVIQYLKKLINSFYKKHLEKPITTFPPINSALPITRPIIKPTKPTTKRKQDKLANNANKQVRNRVLDTCDI